MLPALAGPRECLWRSEISSPSTTNFLEKKFAGRKQEWGEVNLAWQWGANVIFDDNASICMEAASWDMEHYPGNTKWCDHQWCGGGYSSFKAAVDAYLQAHQDD